MRTGSGLPSSELCRDMHVQAAKQAADAVIPNEYGIDPAGKLRIGGKICASLLGKVLGDLANMREESLATAVRASLLSISKHASRPNARITMHTFQPWLCAWCGNAVLHLRLGHICHAHDGSCFQISHATR